MDFTLLQEPTGEKMCQRAFIDDITWNDLEMDDVS